MVRTRVVNFILKVGEYKSRYFVMRLRNCFTEDEKEKGAGEGRGLK
jgi:hypothetical protein